MKEEQLQIQVADYLRSLPQLKDVLWFHTPNEGKMKPQYGAKRKRMGVRSGVPDIMVCKFTKHKDKMFCFYGLAIELKVGKNKPTAAQLECLDMLNNEGWRTAVCYTFDEAKQVIDEYLGL